MKTFITICCTAASLLMHMLYAEIIEIAHFEELEQYVTEKTLVILDIDDTLLIPVQALGTDAWFLHQLNKHMNNDEVHDPLDQTLAEWEAIRHLTDVQRVEDHSRHTVAKLQEQGIAVMGLTTQDLALTRRTINQLNQLGFHLNKTAPYPEDLYFVNQKGVLYRQGILFTSGTKKGAALLKMLDMAEYAPLHVLFINDKQTHLLDVEHALQEHGIPFTGLRYAYSDDRIANFRSDITDIQFHYSSFGQILSDHQAEALLPDH